MLHLSVGLFVALLVVGAILLAFWTLARFDRLGPSTMAGVVAHMLAAMMLVSVLPKLVGAVGDLHLPDAVSLISLGLILPLLTYLFVASGWFVRFLVGLLAGLR